MKESKIGRKHKEAIVAVSKSPKAKVDPAIVEELRAAGYVVAAEGGWKLAEKGELLAKRLLEVIDGKRP